MSLSSPCIRLCRLDDDRELCLGCGRSLAEIAAWSGLDESRRRAIMAGLPDRLAAATDPGLDEAPRPPSATGP